MHKFNIQDSELELPIWRYMDLSKFLDLLENSHLFFPSVELFEDKFEGIHNAIGENDFYDLNHKNEPIEIAKAKNPRQIDTSKKLKRIISDGVSEISQSTGVSCWRISQYESHAMWKIFLNSNEGIAIKTRASKLSKNINETNLNLNLHIGKVKYIDYSKVKIPIESVIEQLFHKNIYFEHEKEFRLLAYNIKNQRKQVFGNNNLKPLINNGITVKVKPKVIIEEIIVSPYAPLWFYDLVVKVSKEKYNLNIPINLSSIELKKK